MKNVFVLFGVLFLTAQIQAIPVPYYFYCPFDFCTSDYLVLDKTQKKKPAPKPRRQLSRQQLEALFPTLNRIRIPKANLKSYSLSHWAFHKAGKNGYNTIAMFAFQSMASSTKRAFQSVKAQFEKQGLEISELRATVHYPGFQRITYTLVRNTPKGPQPYLDWIVSLSADRRGTFSHVRSTTRLHVPGIRLRIERVKD